MSLKNLTKSSYRIFLSTPNNELSDIYWESFTGIGETSQAIETSNGVNKYTITPKGLSKPVTIARASNVEDDARILSWIKSFCDEQDTVTGLQFTTTLIALPLKGCAVAKPYSKTIKVFDVRPTDYNLFDADVMDTSSVSRTTITLSNTGFEFS